MGQNLNHVLWGKGELMLQALFTFSLYLRIGIYGLPWWLSGKESAGKAGDAASFEDAQKNWGVLK